MPRSPRKLPKGVCFCSVYVRKMQFASSRVGREGRPVRWGLLLDESCHGRRAVRAVKPPWGPEDRELHLMWSRVGGPYEQFVIFLLG